MSLYVLSINFLLFKSTGGHFSLQLRHLCQCPKLESKGQGDLLPLSEKH